MMTDRGRLGLAGGLAGLFWAAVLALVSLGGSLSWGPGPGTGRYGALAVTLDTAALGSPPSAARADSAVAGAAVASSTVAGAAVASSTVAGAAAPAEGSPEAGPASAELSLSGGLAAAGPETRPGEGFPGGTGAGSLSGAGAGNRELALLNAALQKNFSYPLLARKRGISGTVLLDINITKDGRLETCTVAASSGSSLLDEAATHQLERVFPVAGVSGPLQTQVAIEFKLR